MNRENRNMYGMRAGGVESIAGSISSLAVPSRLVTLCPKDMSWENLTDMYMYDIIIMARIKRKFSPRFVGRIYLGKGLNGETVQQKVRLASLKECCGNKLTCTAGCDSHPAPQRDAGFRQHSRGGKLIIN